MKVLLPVLLLVVTGCDACETQEPPPEATEPEPVAQSPEPEPRRELTETERAALREAVSNGRDHAHAGSYPEAIHEFERALEVVPNTGALLCELGFIRHRSGDLPSAAADLDQGLDSMNRTRARDERWEQTMGMCLYNRGRVFEEEGEPDRARDYYLNSLAFRENSTVQARIDALPGSAEDTPTDLASLLAPASEPLACEGPFERLEDALAEFDYETEVRDEGPVGAHRVRVIAHGDDLSAGPDLFVALQAGGFWHLSQRPLVMGMGRTAFAHTEVLGFEFEMARAASGQPVLLIESRVSDSDYPCADMYWDPEGENEEFLAREECQASTSVTTELALLSLEDKCLTERARYVLRVETGETDCHLNREVSDGHLVLAAGSGPPNCLDQLSPPGRFPLLP